jgi:hypothetical protein
MVVSCNYSFFATFLCQRRTLQELEALLVLSQPSALTKRLLLRYQPEQQLQQLKQQLLDQSLPAIMQVRGSDRGNVSKKKSSTRCCVQSRRSARQPMSIGVDCAQTN